jgi:methyltransferase (TIGR00027 family)
MATCSHQDATRKNVSVTALGVAYLRGLESEIHPQCELFYDPYARELGGEPGKEWVDSMKNDEASLKKILAIASVVSLRTKKIDDEVSSILLNDNICQICVLGAGLDTRPWRLQTALPDQSHIKYYEVDFPEIFDYKLPILQAHCAKELFDYKKVEADLSLPSWLEKLEGAGFDRGERTLWLLEGLTGYLTEDELTTLFQRITELSAVGSRLVATFLTPKVNILHIGLHRFYPDDPLTYVQQFGWHGQQEDIEDFAISIGRPSHADSAVRNYFVVTIVK